MHRDDDPAAACPAVPGKGEVLWRSLLVTSGDIVCFVDADLREFSADFVSGIVGPLLTEPGGAAGQGDVRPAAGDRRRVVAGQGGRVTELVARPLLNLHWPQLAGFVQPLGGEYAARRSLLEQLPVPRRLRRGAGHAGRRPAPVGLDALAQVDVGVRKHRHQDGQALGRMAAAIYRTAQLRLARGPPGPAPRSPSSTAARTASSRAPTPVDTEERPPMREIAEYAGAAGGVTHGRRPAGGRCGRGGRAHV